MGGEQSGVVLGPGLLCQTIEPTQVGVHCKDRSLLVVIAIITILAAMLPPWPKLRKRPVARSGLTIKSSSCGRTRWIGRFYDKINPPNCGGGNTMTDPSMPAGWALQAGTGTSHQGPTFRSLP